MSMRARLFALNLPASTLLAVAGTLMLLASDEARAAGCAGQAFCTEVPAFVASLNDFRSSTLGNNRRLTVTITFQNKTDRPLTLGYVDDSGVALDEHGNRYTVKNAGAGAVRGIGEIDRRTFDPKFTLQPGERSDARFELNWYAGNSIAGVAFTLDLAIREIDAVTGDQYRLGREHALRFTGLADGAVSAARATGAGIQTTAQNAAQTGTAAATTAATNEAYADPCAGNTRCYATGPLVAEIAQLVSAQSHNNNHAVRVNLRIRNVSNQPLILAYQQNSGTMLDNYGNKYTVDWRSNQNVSGIGQSTRQKADPQFVLSPGEARNATLTYSRYVGKTAIGTVFSPDLVLEQLEILPSQQIRSVRDYNISFTGIGPGAGAPAGDAQSINDAARQLTEGLRSIFKKK